MLKVSRLRKDPYWNLANDRIQGEKTPKTPGSRKKPVTPRSKKGKAAAGDDDSADAMDATPTKKGSAKKVLNGRVEKKRG